MKYKISNLLILSSIFRSVMSMDNSSISSFEARFGYLWHPDQHFRSLIYGISANYESVKCSSIGLYVGVESFFGKTEDAFYNRALEECLVELPFYTSKQTTLIPRVPAAPGKEKKFEYSRPKQNSATIGIKTIPTSAYTIISTSVMIAIEKNFALFAGEKSKKDFKFKHINFGLLFGFTFDKIERSDYNLLTMANCETNYMKEIKTEGSITTAGVITRPAVVTPSAIAVTTQRALWNKSIISDYLLGLRSSTNVKYSKIKMILSLSLAFQFMSSTKIYGYSLYNNMRATLPDAKAVDKVPYAWDDIIMRNKIIYGILESENSIKLQRDIRPTLIFEVKFIKKLSYGIKSGIGFFFRRNDRVISTNINNVVCANKDHLNDIIEDYVVSGLIISLNYCK